VVTSNIPKYATSHKRVKYCTDETTAELSIVEPAGVEISYTPIKEQT